MVETRKHIMRRNELSDEVENDFSPELTSLGQFTSCEFFVRLNSPSELSCQSKVSKKLYLINTHLFYTSRAQRVEFFRAF